MTSLHFAALRVVADDGTVRPYMAARAIELALI